MKRRILSVFLGAVMLVALMLTLASCDIINGIIGGNETSEAPDLSGISFSDKTVTYNGEAQSLAIEGTLPEGVTVEYSGNGKTDAGKYTVVASFFYNGEKIENADLAATLRINKASLSDAMDAITFPSKSFVYDGTAKSIAIVGTLPDGVEVSYEGNGATEVGRHTVTAKFTVDTDNYYEISDMTAVITILEAEAELPTVEGVTLADMTVVYDGAEHSLAIEGALPEGVTVEYVNNGKVNAGTYYVEAKFFYGDIELEGQSLRARLRIEKAVADLSGITFPSKTVLYTGTAQSIAIEGALPDYATVSYIGNGQTSPGTYKVLAVFNVGANYVAVPDMEAYLTILGPTAGLSDVSLRAASFAYDGTAKSIAVSGTLPTGVTVAYEGNGVTEIGTYTVTAKFYKDGVYIEGSDLYATITITKADVDMSGVSFSDATVAYDGQAHSILVDGTLPEGVTASYVGNENTLPGVYTVTVSFTVADAEHYNTPADMTATLIINHSSESLSGITFPSATFTYDGLVHRVEIEGTLPEGISVRYTDNVKSEVGTYSAKAQFYFGGEHIEGADLGATLKIEKADVDMSGVIFEGASFIFDGTAKSIFVSGNLPAGVTVSYEGNEQIAVGSYTVTAKFAIEGAENYNEIADMTATLVIDPNPRDVSAIAFNGTTVTYDGLEHSVFIEGELNADLTVEYVGNGVVAVGSHTVIAKFYYKGEYIEGADKTAVIVIEHANAELSHIVFNGATFDADGAPKSIYITGDLPAGYTVEYDGNGATDAGTYTVTAKFYINGAYVEGADMVATYTIIATALPEIIAENLVVDFDGKLHEINYATAGTLPEGVAVITIGNAQYMPGTYTFVFRYSLADEAEGKYDIPEDVTVTLTINAIPEGYATEGLTYTAVTGGYAVSGYTGDSAYVVIPDTYNGKAVIAIAASAFKNNTTVRNVIIPDSVTAIAQGAFRGTQLEEITVPFIGGSKISSNKYFGYIFGAQGYVANEIYVPVTLKRVIISDACTYIPAYSFRSCIAIEEIVIGSGVTEIGISAFEKCESLKSIYIPANVVDVPAAAHYYNSPFFGCSAEGFTVYLEAASVPTTGYGAHWNSYDENTKVNVVCGKSYEEYLAIKNS